MKIVILANDIGEKLWPLANPATPKALLPLYSQHSMLEETIYYKAFPLCEGKGRDVYIVTTAQAKQHIKELKLHTKYNILLKHIIPAEHGESLDQIIPKLKSIDDDETVMFVPADQFFWPEEAFLFHIYNTLSSLDLYRKCLFNFVLKPGMPATNMDYMRIDWDQVEPIGTSHSVEGHDVELATEVSSAIDYIRLPDFSTAETLIEDGWVWDIKITLGSMANFRNLIWAEDYPEKMIESSTLKAVIVNHAIWSVIDNWAALKYLTHDAGLFESADDPSVHSIESHNNLIKKTTDKEIVLIGVDDLIVIDTDDKLLIASPVGAHEYL